MPILLDFPESIDPATGLSLRQVYLNAAGNLADLCAFSYAGESISVSTDSRAEVRQLIDRRRVIRTGTKTYDQYGLDLRWLTPAQQQWLREHVATVVCVRDHVGTKVHATYLTLPVEVPTTPISGEYRAKAQLRLDEVTYSEAV